MTNIVLHARNNHGVPAAIRARYEELLTRREAESLTPDEHEELLCLVAQIEALQVERAEHLTRLARSRGVSIRTLMDELGAGQLEHG